MLMPAEEVDRHRFGTHDPVRGPNRPTSPAEQAVTDTPDPLEQPPQWAMDLLRECEQDWMELSDYRTRRKEARDDYRGYQWQRKVDDGDGNMVTERELIERQGRVPVKMNHIAPTIRNLKGQMLQNESERMAYAVNRKDNEAAEQMTVALKAARRINEADSLEADQFEEHLVSGMHSWKVTAGWEPSLDRNEVQMDRVATNRLFYNRDVEGRRLTNLRRIGEIHEITIDELVEQLADSPVHEEQLRQVYADRSNPMEGRHSPSGFDAADNLDFYYPNDPEKCRAIEVWYKEWEWVKVVHDPFTGDEARITWSQEEILLENEFRAQMGFPQLEVETTKEPVWHYAFLSPEGHVLDQGETPYWHQEHPYVVGFAQFMDGEMWGLVEDIQDPQRLINRITSAIDFMLSASAKGVLLVDEDVIEESEISLDEVAEKWTSFNGVIALKAKGNQKVSSAMEQVTAASIPAGLFEWLASQKQWVKELSGVLGAQQGHEPPSGTPASLYAQQQVQASMTTLTFFDTFFKTLYRLDKKAIQCIMQYYDEPRTLATGDRAPLVQYDPERVRELDYDVAVADTQDTATFRLQFEKTLREFLDGGYLTFPQFLQVSAHPKAQQLQKIVKRSNPLIGAPTAMDTADPELSEALMNAAEAGDVEARTLLMQAQQTPAAQEGAPTQNPMGAGGGTPSAVPRGGPAGGAPTGGHAKA